LFTGLPYLQKNTRKNIKINMSGKVLGIYNIIEPIDIGKINNININELSSISDFKINILQSLKTKINKTRDLYDAPYEKNMARLNKTIRTNEFGTYVPESVVELFKTPYVNNAWLKGYELFNHYGVFPEHSAKKFVHFDNASFPGSFIIAAHHMVKTKCKLPLYKWYGSSLLDPNNLGDGYQLYEHYPENWVMGNYDGDVTNWEYQKFIRSKLQNKVDLYTSDLGFGIGKQYNKQEELHAHAHLGQILTGLLTLKVGGISITKHYSIFDSFTVSMVAIMTVLFDGVEISKPLFSRSGNNETYIVGLGFKGCESDINQLLIDIMIKRLKEWNYTSLLPVNTITSKFVKSLIKSQNKICKMQFVTIKTNLISFNSNMGIQKMKTSFVKRNQSIFQTIEDKLQLQILDVYL
jgi:hypothetical protein